MQHKKNGIKKILEHEKEKRSCQWRSLKPVFVRPFVTRHVGYATLSSFWKVIKHFPFYILGRCC